MGIVEDVLMKVSEFMFSIDFLILDIKAKPITPIILGRPFLSIKKALIDVGVVGDQIIF